MATILNDTKTYTIKEAAKLSGLPESTLRYYETIGLIPQIERDSSSKYRVYSEQDVDYIISIACLNATGLSIPDMQLYLSNVDMGDEAADDQIRLLDNQGRRLVEEERSLKLRQKYLRTKADYWRAIKSYDPELAEQIAGEARAIAKQVKDSQVNL